MLTWLDLGILVCWLAAFLFVGFYSRTQIQTVDDYVVAGRRLKPFVLASTIMASLTGAGMTLGVSGQGYTIGAGALWSYFGFTAGLLFSAFLAPYMYKYVSQGVTSLPEVFGARFGVLPQVMAGIVSAAYTLALVGYSIMGMSNIVSYIGEPWGVTRVSATVIMTVVTILYTAMGGFWSVALTDAIQFIIMLITVILLGPVIAAAQAGGLDIIGRAVSANGFSLWNPFVGMTMSMILSSFFLFFFPTIIDPTVPQRIFAAESAKTARRGLLSAAITVPLYGYGLTVMASGGRVLMPDLATTYGTVESVVPVLIMKYFPPVVAALGLAGIFSAVMSTVDSMLVLSATHLIRDIIGKLSANKTFEQQMGKILPVTVTALGIVALVIALYVNSVFHAMAFVFSLINSALFIPLMATLFWKKATSAGVSAGIAGGAVVNLYLFFTGVAPGGDPMWVAMLASLLLTVGVSVMTQANARASVEKSA